MPQSLNPPKLYKTRRKYYRKYLVGVKMETVSNQSRKSVTPVGFAVRGKTPLCKQSPVPALSPHQEQVSNIICSSLSVSSENGHTGPGLPRILRIVTMPNTSNEHQGDDFAAGDCWHLLTEGSLQRFIEHLPCPAGCSAAAGPCSASSKRLQMLRVQLTFLSPQEAVARWGSPSSPKQQGTGHGVMNCCVL